MTKTPTKKTRLPGKKFRVRKTGDTAMLEPIEVCGPCRQRMGFLGAEIVPVIDSRHTADHAAAVVQDAFDDVRRDPER